MRYLILIVILIFNISTSVRADTYNLPAVTSKSNLLFDRDLSKPGYSFVASAIVSPNRAQLWYCGSDNKNPGDHIMYRNAKTIEGPFGILGKNTYEVALRPTRFENKLNRFDAWHTCDVSTIKVGTKFYMYYGGASIAPNGVNKYDQKYVTEIGVAVSTDARTWTRANGGKSILRSNKLAPTPSSGNNYGTGQPSAVYRNGKTYLFYTDTVSQNSNSSNGAGTYVIRSSDPLFQNSVEFWTAEGWKPSAALGTTESIENYLVRVSKPLALVVSTDTQWSAAMDAWVMSIHGVAGKLEIAVLDKNDFHITFDQFVAYKGAVNGITWADGPGLFHQADGSSVTGSAGVQPIRSIWAGTTTDVFGAKLYLDQTLLTKDGGIPGPIPPTPVPTPSPTPTPIPPSAGMTQGYDDIGLATHCPVYLKAPALPGLSTLLVTFGDPLPCVEKAINERGVSSVQVDLIDATCWRNKVCLPGAARPDDLNEIKKRAGWVQNLAVKYRGVKFLVSPALEHDIKDPQTVINMLDAAEEGCPACDDVINSPVSGAKPPGYDVELHGTKVSSTYVSADGASSFDGDNIKNDGNSFQHRLSGKKATYAWWNELNRRCTGENDWVPVADRTVQPELWQYQMAHKIFTTTEDSYGVAPRQCRRVTTIRKPEIGKPTSERYCNGQSNSNDVRGNKNLLILKKSGRVGDRLNIYSSTNVKVGCFRLYGNYSEAGLYRWYQGDCSGLTPWELYQKLGNEYGYLDFGGGDCLMFNSLRRQGVYR